MNRYEITEITIKTDHKRDEDDVKLGWEYVAGDAYHGLTVLAVVFNPDEYNFGSVYFKKPRSGKLYRAFIRSNGPLSEVQGTASKVKELGAVLANLTKHGAQINPKVAYC